MVKSADYYGQPTVTTEENNTFDGKNAVYFGASDAIGEVSALTLPRIDVDSIKNLIVSFYINYNYPNQRLDVGVVSDPRDISTFELVESVANRVGNTWQYAQVNMGSYVGNGQYITFRCGHTNTYNYIYLDDIRVVDNSTCQQPPMFHIGNPTPTTVRLQL